MYLTSRNVAVFSTTAQQSSLLDYVGNRSESMFLGSWTQGTIAD